MRRHIGRAPGIALGHRRLKARPLPLLALAQLLPLLKLLHRAWLQLQEALNARADYPAAKHIGDAITVISAECGERATRRLRAHRPR